MALADYLAALAVSIDISSNALSLHPADKFNLAVRVAAAISARYSDADASSNGPSFRQVRRCRQIFQWCSRLLGRVCPWVGCGLWGV